jgi:putative membrane protein
MKHIKRLIIGTIIGGGMILPGVSGGVLAVVFGIYETMLDSIANFFKNIKKNTIYLMPIILGIILGVFIFGKALFFLFDEYPMEAKYTFMGLILGGVPVLFKEVDEKGTKKINGKLLLFSFVVSISLFVLGKDSLNIDFSKSIDGDIISYVLLFLTGTIFIMGKIVPGISSSFLLMLIGMYQYFLNILNNPFGLSKSQYIEIIPFIAGIIIGGLFVIKIIRKLLKNHFSNTYSAIIGFVIGSVAAIYPGFSFDLKGLIGICLFAISLLISYKFSQTSQKNAKES